MQMNIAAHHVHAIRRNATALFAATAVCLTLAFPLPGLAADAVQSKPAATKLAKYDMLGSIAYVPSGVIDVILKQKEGYAYLKP